MTLSANTIFEIRTAGDNNAGGGFVAGASGTDYSQQNAIHATRTDLVIDGTIDTDITSAADNFASDDVGNLINITAGTGFTVGRYEIVSVAAGVATLDRAVGTLGSTGGTGYLGGAYDDLNATFMNIATAGNTFYIKADATYTLTANWGMGTDGTSVFIIAVEGYKTTRGDGTDAANWPVIVSGAFTMNFDNYVSIKYLDISTTNANGLRVDLAGIAHRCKVNNTSGTAGREAFTTADGSSRYAIISNCEAISLSGNGIIVTRYNQVLGCYVHDCGQNGISTSISCAVFDCILDTITLVGVSLVDNGVLSGSTIYNCGTGVSPGNKNPCITKCIIDNCVTGVNVVNPGNNQGVFDYINFSNNTADTAGDIPVIANETALDPQFVDAANGNFETGANMAITFAFPGGLTLTTIKNGAVQNAGGGADKIGKLVGFGGGLVS